MTMQKNDQKNNILHLATLTNYETNNIHIAKESYTI